MYVKPSVESFGTFRELTLIGNQSAADMIWVNGISPDGSNCSLDQGTPAQPGVITCRYSGA